MSGWKDIQEAFLEKTQAQRTIGKIKRLTKQEAKDEHNVNSLINELENVFFNAKNSFSKQNVEIKGIIGHPNLSVITNKNKIGSKDDPRIYLESLDKNEEFNKRFRIQKGISDNGNEQYTIVEKEL